MASLLLAAGGAILNAVAFSGSNYLFSRIGHDDPDVERKRYDEAVEKLQAAQIAWNKQRTERLDFLNQELQQQAHAARTYQDVDEAMREYNMVTEKQLTSLPPEPKLEDYYTPSEGQKTRELVFVAAGMAATGIIAYKLL